LRRLRALFEKAGVSNRRLSEAVGEVRIFQPQIPYRAMPERFRSKNPRFKNPTIFEESIERLLPAAFGKPHPSQYYVAHPLVEEVYPRATPASLKIITPRHKELCNEFIRWLDREGRWVVGREKGRVDVEFKDGSIFCRAELKVCYGMTPTFAIREALGQLLEYNYYGWRIPADRWLIVLDSAPTEHDREYVRRLSKRKNLPLQLRWRSGSNFVNRTS